MVLLFSNSEAVRRSIYMCLTKLETVLVPVTLNKSTRNSLKISEKCLFTEIG